MDAVRPKVNERSGSGRNRSLWQMALSNSSRVPGRTLLAAGVLALGVAALTTLTAIQTAFRGVLAGSLLGHYVAVEVRGVDLLSATLTLVLAALAVADVVYLSVQERRTELAVLAASGWSTRKLESLVVFEGMCVGALGVIAGTSVGIIVGLVGGGRAVGLVEAAAVAGGAGLLVSLAASMIPAEALSRQPFVRVLSGE
jgi:ABC-type antimicrobial peptide transport system permease subunit